MFKLDHGGKDKEKLKKALPSLSEIQDHQSGWKDDFQLNSTLRRKFRVSFTQEVYVKTRILSQPVSAMSIQTSVTWEEFQRRQNNIHKITLLKQ